MKLLLKKLRMLPQKYNFFYFVFISYLFFLLFSVLFSVYNYTIYISDLKEQKRMYDSVMFQQFDEMIVGELAGAETLLVNVLTDTDILKTVNADNLISSRELSQTLRGSARMRGYSKTAVSDMYMYFDKSDAVIMGGSYYRSEEFYRQYIDPDKISYEEWHEQQTDVYFKSYRQSDSVNPNKLVLYHTVKGASSDKKALLAVFVDLEDIFKIFQESFFSGQMSFQIKDSNGEILAEYGGDFEGADNRQITPFTSERTGWTYLSAIPSRVYNQAIHVLLERIALVLLTELAIGVLFSFFFARTNTAPVRALYERLSGHGKARQTGVKNEYKLVDSRIDNLLEEEEQLLEHHSQLVKNNMLLAILNSGMSRNEAEGDYLRSIGIDLCGAGFQVISIMIEYGDKLRDNSLGIQSLIKYRLVDLVNKAFSEEYRVNFADVSWNQISVIAAGSLEGRTNAVCANFDTVRNDIESEFSVSLTIGVGNVHDFFEGLSASYRESMLAMEHRIITDRGFVCSYRDISSGESNGFPQYVYPVIDRTKIKISIHSGDGPGTVALMDNVFAEITSGRTDVPLEVTKCLFFEIMGLGLEALTEIKFEQETSHAKYMEMLFGCKTVSQLQRTMNCILTDICDSIKKGQGKRGQWLHDRISAYIEQHCYDNSFSLVSLADYLNLTPTYLSSFFKEKLGENLVDRISRMRIDKAKDLLVNTKWNVSEIAVKVGYGSSGTFIRNFKKQEAITPTQFRQEYEETLPDFN